MFSRCPFVRPSVRSSHLTCQHDILKINEQILMPTDTSGRCDKDMKRSTLWSVAYRSRSHETEDRFVGLAETSFSTSLGRVAFLVVSSAAL